MNNRPVVTVSVRIPLAHYQRLVEYAKARRLITQTGRANVSEAMRQVVRQGLEVSSESASATLADNQ